MGMMLMYGAGLISALLGIGSGDRRSRRLVVSCQGDPRRPFPHVHFKRQNSPAVCGSPSCGGLRT